jgi:hypothetical protein
MQHHGNGVSVLWLGLQKSVMVLHLVALVAADGA